VIYDLERGASDTRLLVEPPDRVYASWTEWDETGTGQAIYFSRSLDGGNNWESPIKLTERAEDEYERDWNKLVLLGTNELCGRRLSYYRYASTPDDGETWVTPWIPFRN
jgi:hypothetical protein